MLKLTDLETISKFQQQHLNDAKTLVKRDLMQSINLKHKSHALIISGIRRCGKSTLLGQLITGQQLNAFYINFDTPKLYNFELGDFELLDKLIESTRNDTLCFDEIQVVDGWELYIRQKLDQNYRVIITGSNASLLSKELGTKLTGRHITKELFPFSFLEFIRFYSIEPDENSFSRFITHGGFPEYLKTGNAEILTNLINDILYRDIAVRYNIRDTKTLKHLLVFLLSNVGNLVTAGKLIKMLSIKSTATLLDYFSYFEQSYLISLLPKFSYSHRAQLINPRKIFFIDTGMIRASTASFSEDSGHKLENIIFWELRRKNYGLFYFNENGKECDFIVTEKNEVRQIIQVCYNLTINNQNREINGLVEAMDYFDKREGTLVTFNQENLIIHKNKKIKVVPAHKFISMLYA